MIFTKTADDDGGGFFGFEGFALRPWNVFAAAGRSSLYVVNITNFSTLSSKFEPKSR